VSLKKYSWLVLIFGIALFFRTYKLAEIPYGFHVDEVKAGWNAYSILMTGKDDKGNLLPVYYDSFGDFRPAGLIYLIIPSLLIFGKTIFAVRLPFALFGAMTVIPLFFFVLEITEKNSKSLALIAAVLLALNPWHIIASRATSESVIAMFLAVWGLYFFVRIFRSNNLIDTVLSYLCFGLSFFFYHSIRILAPVFLLIILCFYQIVLENKKRILKQIGLIVVLLITTGLIFLSPEASGRMSQVSLKSDFQVLYEITKMPNEETAGHLLEARIFHNKIASYLRRFAEEYKDYFGTNFLLGNTAKPVRYTVPYVGLMTYVEFIFVIIGLFWVTKRKEMLIILAILLISPLPAAVTIEDNPNLQRAIFMIPFLVILEAYGLSGLKDLSSKWKWILYLAIIGYTVNFVYFSHMYFTHQKMSIATYYRDGGNVELVNNLSNIRNKYNKIVLTNSPDDLYPWVAFGLYGDAKIFNKAYSLNKNEFHQVDNFVFSKDKCPIKKLMETLIVPENNTLYVDAEGCNYDNMKLYPGYMIKEIEVIHRPDGSPPYYLRTVEYKKQESL
jgi:4-amino-4-deoxy-L-arabinose transferase-like glycosyltransferase